MEMGTGFPGYTGIMPRSTATIGQILQNNGYSTAWIGKNHNVPSNMLNNVGPFRPLAESSGIRLLLRVQRR